MGAEAPVSIVCLCGPTCSGKTTLVTFLKQTLALQKNTEVITIAQDDFYKPAGFDVVEGFDDWDAYSAIDWAAFRAKVLSHAQSPHGTESSAPIDNNDSILRRVVLVDGHLLALDEGLLKMASRTIFLNISETSCRTRRFQRDEWLRVNPRYFDLCIKPHFDEVHQEVQRIISLGKYECVVIDGEQPLEELTSCVVASLLSVT